MFLLVHIVSLPNVYLVVRATCHVPVAVAPAAAFPNSANETLETPVRSPIDTELSGHERATSASD